MFTSTDIAILTAMKRGLQPASPMSKFDVMRPSNFYKVLKTSVPARGTCFGKRNVNQLHVSGSH